MPSQIPTDVYILLVQYLSMAIPWIYFQLNIHVKDGPLTLWNGKALKWISVQALVISLKIMNDSSLG